MNKNLTEIVFILDRSGSMAGLESDTIGGFNSMVEKQKAAPGDAVLSAVLFSNDNTVTNHELTKRETAVLIEVARGLSNKEIAARLNVSIFTVTTHRKNIVRKTGIKSVAGLTVYALLNNLIDEDNVI